MNIDELNTRYASLTPEQRIVEMYKDFPAEKILFTSSFGTTAAILLHMITKVNPNQKVYFLDTTYHFLETIDYKNQLKELLKLDIVDIVPEDWKNDFTKKDQTWTKDPDLCCSINKVEPLDAIKPNFDLWISGLMSNQTSHRKQLDIFEQKSDITKFYPILDFTPEQAAEYFVKKNLPKHPLEPMGYSSIGCAQCTAKGKGREGRWTNKSKTECGLHG